MIFKTLIYCVNNNFQSSVDGFEVWIGKYRWDRIILGGFP